MAPVVNPRIIFTKIPDELPVLGETLRHEENGEQIDLENVSLGGGVLVKTTAISVDPYYRARLRDPKIPSYLPAFEIGKVPSGGALGRVLRSEASGIKKGDLVRFVGPWQTYWTIDQDGLKGVEVIDNPTGLPSTLFLGVAGMPSQTAFYSMKAFSKMKEGETIFVSTAAGAVGSVVCQLAKLKGLKVIGSAGDDDKVKFLLEDLKLDAAFNYKKKSVWDALKDYGPIDIYFDNVGGEQLDAAIANANKNGRIIVCGYISEYNKGQKESYGVKSLGNILTKTLSINGFLVNDLIGEMGRDVFTKEYLPLVSDGKIKYREDRTVGLDKFPEALIAMLKGENQGKPVVVVSPDDVDK